MRPLTLPSLIFISLIAAACANSSDTPTSPRVIPSSSSPTGAPSTDIPVTTTIYDADAADNPLLTRSDDYNGAGFATYATVGKLTTHINSSGGWQLYLGNQTVRTIYLVLASQGIPVPDGRYAANVEVYSLCYDQSDTEVSLLSMTAGASIQNCSFGVDFSSGQTKYKLAMGPKNAGTGRATATCNAVATGGCTNWTIAPNPNAANAGAANLYHFGKTGSLILDGVYRNSYAVTLAR